MKTIFVILLGLIIGGALSYFVRPWYISASPEMISPSITRAPEPDTTTSDRESSESAHPVGGMPEDGRREPVEIVPGYYLFDQSHYEESLEDYKIVFLYFCSDEDPICAVEIPDIEEGFHEISAYDVIGFYVPYGTDDATDDEMALAEVFDIDNQHTKLILVDGEEEVRATDAWTKPRFLEAFEEL